MNFFVVFVTTSNELRVCRGGKKRINPTRMSRVKRRKRKIRRRRMHIRKDTKSSVITIRSTFPIKVEGLLVNAMTEIVNPKDTNKLI